jgi:enoyl-CoA hydratase/carnithine racemase
MEFTTIGVATQGPVATVALRRPEALNATTKSQIRKLVSATSGLDRC